MHVITRKRLNEFVDEHPDAETPLANWYRLTKKNRFRNFTELRALFPAADQVGNKTVFNIGGNKYRLIAAIHYNRNRIYIRAILTHREYDKGNWKTA
ncbi:MAG TPA: type II toxin-antitoxin system HigB family toxin [Candidatus Methylacidiphilales bacterium]|jgi:mRNA interferase HigB|nr:type II toxin-antitoxin system HigB family toxin [Candidatus Methylacidiphilales bacterium]